jgi:ribonucleotide reductase alpha subunit
VTSCTSKPTSPTSSWIAPVCFNIRVAHAIAGVERDFDHAVDVKSLEEEFYGLMSNLEFLPNSPTLMNAGTALGQLSACFVIPVEDSIIDIYVISFCFRV